MVIHADQQGDLNMLVFGIDAHKRTHTIVAINERGRPVGQRVINATSEDHLALLAWAEQLGDQRLWAVEDCRHLSRRLERDLLCAGERIVRVPTKMMAGARRTSRDYGKSDPIDALAVARAALQEPDLPVACLDGLLVTFGFWSTIVRISWPNAHGSSTGCAGICTNSTRPGIRQLAPSIGPKPWPK
jgi:hypothetical protein